VHAFAERYTGAMAFRGSSFVAREGRIVHGPFPVRWRVLNALVVFGLLVMMTAWLGRNPRTLSCTAGPQGTCTLQGERNVARFARASLRGARAEVHGGPSQSTRGELVLEEARGDRGVVAWNERGAQLAADKIDAGLRSGDAFSVSIANPPLWIVIVMVLFGAAGVARLVVVARNAGRFEIDVITSGAGVRVTRRLLGVSLGARVLSIEDARDVEVERAGGAHERGRLVIVRKTGERVPLSARFYAGLPKHEQAAEELRRVIAVDARTEVAARP
jgi:hypothetical protein